MRQDLYFRLNVFHINLPPLREHKDDIPLLVEHILRDVNAKHGKHVRGIGAEVLDIFMGHTWPGNIRELRNVLERASIMSEKDLITRACLPEEFEGRRRKGRAIFRQSSFPWEDGRCNGARAHPADAGRNREQQDAGGGTARHQPETLHNKLKEYGGDRAETE